MERTRIGVFCLALAFAFAAAILSSCDLFGGQGHPTYLLQKSDGFYTPTGEGDRAGGPSTGLAADEAAGAGGSGSPVEPDVYYLDEAGSMLYAANSYRGLVAFDISDRLHPRLAGRWPIEGAPKELYFAQGRLVLLADPSSSYYYGYAMARGSGSRAASASTSAAYFIEPSSFGAAGAPSPTRLELGGPILDSRLVGNSLVVATNEGYLGAATASSATTGTADAAVASSSPVGSFRATIRVVDVAGQAQASAYPVQGSCTAIYVASDAVFAALGPGDWSSSTSTIARFDIEDGALESAGSVGLSGCVSDRFKLDWSGGYLRVVAFDQRSWSDRVTRVFAVDWRDAAAPVSYEKADENGKGGALELATGETLYASRFDGDLAYVVTFLTKDPLFVISFADPAKPVKVGQCSPPGYSTHIEAVTGVGGERLLFAVGVEGGQTKASVFDVSDQASPTEKGSVLLGHGESWSYSPANWDWKRICRLDALSAFALPYYAYDYGTGTGGYAVALVAYSAAGPSLLCELPDSGDVERTIPVAADLVYTYAADRLLAWRIQDPAPELVSEAIVAENVAWASELGGVGLKIVRSENKIFLRSFASAAYAGTGSLSSVELPASAPTGGWLYYPLGTEGIAVLPELSSIFIIAEAWTAGGENAVYVYKASLRGDASIKLEAEPLALGGGWGYAPPPGRSGPRFILAAGSSLVVFHGGAALVDAAAWPACRDVPCESGVAAFAYGQRLAAFSWQASSSLDGYGRMSVSEWDLGSTPPARLSGPSSFPGFPLYRAEDGSYISAYTPAYWQDETVLLSVGSVPEAPAVLGEARLPATLGDFAAFGGELAMLARSGGSYYYEAVAADRSARGSSAPRLAAGTTALMAARPTADSIVLADVAELSGWGAVLAASPPDGLPPRLAAASTSEALTCASDSGSLVVLGRTELPAGGWYTAGIAFGGSFLYAASGYAGISRAAAR